MYSVQLEWNEVMPYATAWEEKNKWINTNNGETGGQKAMNYNTETTKKENESRAKNYILRYSRFVARDGDNATWSWRTYAGSGIYRVP